MNGIESKNLKVSSSSDEKAARRRDRERRELRYGAFDVFASACTVVSVHYSVLLFGKKREQPRIQMCR